MLLLFRGALEMVHQEVACWFVQDTLTGLQLTLLFILLYLLSPPPPSF